MEQVVVCVLRRVFKVCIGVPVGDICCLWPQGNIESARTAIKGMCDVPEIAQSPHKEIAPTSTTLLFMECSPPFARFGAWYHAASENGEIKS